MICLCFWGGFSERSPGERRGRTVSLGTDEKGAGGGEGGEYDSHNYTNYTANIGSQKCQLVTS